MVLLKEVSKWLLKKHDATLDDYIEKLDKGELENYKKMGIYENYPGLRFHIVKS